MTGGSSGEGIERGKKGEVMNYSRSMLSMELSEARSERLE